jgi:hypothetical protein
MLSPLSQTFATKIAIYLTSLFDLEYVPEEKFRYGSKKRSEWVSQRGDD